MAYNSSSVMMDSTPSPPGSPGPSSQQHRLLNRVSTLFGGGKKKTVASSIMTDNESIAAASQVDSMMMDDRTASCVDSMYSSLQSRRSNYRPPPNPNVPAPLRTVQLENPIVHLPTPPPPSTSTPLDNQYTVKPSPSQTYSTPLNTPSPPPTTDKRSSNKSKTTAQKIEDIDAQFNLLMREYAPSAHGANNVLNLTFEQKEELIRSSKSPDLLRKNSSFSNVMPAFSLKATFGIKSSKKNKGYSDYTIANPSSFMNEDDSFSDIMTSVKANTAPGRHGKSRSALPTNGFQSYGRKTTRSKLKSTPDYFVHLLRETHVRDLQDNEVLQLQVFLRNVVVSWTSEFLAKGGYDAIANLFEQMKEAPKRFPNDNRILQHLGKCLKTIMTHQPMGTQIVLTNPIALHHVRDILFGPANKKQKQVYGLDISTRSQLLNLLCTLATIQTNRSSEYEYVHGYDVLRRLLLNKATDKIEDDDDKKNQQKHVSPFPITLKTDPKEILQMIMENDPNGQTIGQDYQWDHDELKPRYTAWMRELHFTVEKHIETITFLASALNYNFDSAYRQIKMRQDQADYESESSNGTTVMCEEGVVDYIVTHLRLIRTVVTTQPTSYTGNYDNREQEKMRLELMLSGFDRISKILIQCPHPMIRSSYINYLKPLMNPCADLSAPIVHPFPEVYYEQPMHHHHQESSDDDQVTYEEVSVYAQQDAEEMEDVQESHDRQWRYDDDPYYDDIFYDDDEEDRFDEDGMSDVSMGTYHTEEQQHHYYSNNPNYYATTST